MTNTPTPATAKVVSAEEILNPVFDAIVKRPDFSEKEKFENLLLCMQEYAVAYHLAQQHEAGEDVEQAAKKCVNEIYGVLNGAFPLGIKTFKAGYHLGQSSQAVATGEGIPVTDMTDEQYKIYKLENALTLAMNSAKRRGERIKELEAQLSTPPQQMADGRTILNELLIHLKATNPSEEQKERAIKAVEGLIKASPSDLH